MGKEINFLGDRRKKLTKQEKEDRKILRIGSVFFGLVFALFLAVFALHFALAQQILLVQAQQKTVRDQIVVNQQLERSFVIFVKKLVALTDLYETRLDKRQAIAYLSSILAPDVFLKQITFDQRNKFLVFRVQASDIFHMQKVFGIVNNPDVIKKFDFLTTSTLERTADEKYEMNIIVSTKKL